jgi:cytochrome oxidase assembly protein ShyY1
MVLLRPKWVAGHVLVLVLTVVFVSAGFWQIARNREANDKLTREKETFALPAPAVGTVDLAAGAAANRRVSATGTFDEQHQALLRNRSRHDKPGFDVLTPLRLENGDAILVDRGWVSLGEVAQGVDAGNVPDGTVTVRGLLQRAGPLRAGEAVATEAGAPSLPRVDAARIAKQTGYALLPAYVEAQYQDPAPTSGAPALPEARPTSEVNHISYAVQWFAFAAIALVGWPIVLRRATLRRRPRPLPA